MEDFEGSLKTERCFWLLKARRCSLQWVCRAEPGVAGKTIQRICFSTTLPTDFKRVAGDMKHAQCDLRATCGRQCSFHRLLYHEKLAKIKFWNAWTNMSRRVLFDTLYYFSTQHFSSTYTAENKAFKIASFWPALCGEVACRITLIDEAYHFGKGENPFWVSFHENLLNSLQCQLHCRTQGE